MLTTSPIVSVLIPCYNSELYIAETINSIIAQSYTSWECIVVDDHSNDNSTEIVKKYCLQFPHKIKLFTNPRKGACAARNFAFENSNGKYIQYLDADDLISPDKIERQVQSLQNSPTHLVVCNTWHFLENPDEAFNSDEKYIFSSDNPADFLINLWGGKKDPPHYVAVHSWLTPRNLIEKAGSWNENLSKDQDGEFFARVLLKSTGIIHVSNIKSYYRKHRHTKNTAAQKKREHIESNLLSTQLKEEYLLKLKCTKEAYKAIAAQYKHVAIEAWPKHKDISIIAKKKYNELGGTSYSPELGGVIIELIKKILGWRTAKSLSVFLHESKLIKKILPKSIIK